MQRPRDELRVFAGSGSARIVDCITERLGIQPGRAATLHALRRWFNR